MIVLNLFLKSDFIFKRVYFLIFNIKLYQIIIFLSYYCLTNIVKNE